MGDWELPPEPTAAELLGVGADLSGLLGGAGLDGRFLGAAAEWLAPLPDELEADRLRCEASLAEFVRGAWHVLEPGNPYVHGWHIDCICEHLRAVTDLDILRLVINMPPRHGKSLIVAVFWFCWVWARSPESRWLFSSYVSNLSYRDAAKCLKVIESPWYQARWGRAFRLTKGERAMGKFSNDRAGYRIATSVGGRGLGEGGDYIVVDDPHNAKEVYSDVVRDAVLRWWAETMSTRGNNPNTARKLIVMQRLHQQDLSGHVLASELGYEHLCLPAEAEPRRVVFSLPDLKDHPGRDPIVMTSLQRRRPDLQDRRTEEGGLLWPEQFGPAALGQLKKEISAWSATSGVAGQLQQRPAPEAGDVFQARHFRPFWEERRPWGGRDAVPGWVVPPLPGEADSAELFVPRELCREFQTFDCALKEKQRADWTAMLHFALAPVVNPATGELVRKLLLLLGAARAKVPVIDQYAWVVGHRALLPALNFGQHVEDAAGGIAVIQLGAANGTPFGLVKPGVDDKVARAALPASLYKAGLVGHRKGMAGLSDVTDELLDFPSGRHDDWVDCLSYGAWLYTYDQLLNSQLGGPAAYALGGGPKEGSYQWETGAEADFKDDEHHPDRWYDRPPTSPLSPWGL